MPETKSKLQNHHGVTSDIAVSSSRTTVISNPCVSYGFTDFVSNHLIRICFWTQGAKDIDILIGLPKIRSRKSKNQNGFCLSTNLDLSPSGLLESESIILIENSSRVRVLCTGDSSHYNTGDY